jgi:hypothetical protein
MKESEAIILINHTMPKGNSAIDIQLRGALNMAIQALEEKQQYNEIGTIEELKVLKEKSEPKKQGNINDFDSHLRLSKAGFLCCGSTNKEIRYPLISLRDLEHCPRCGQKLNWDLKGSEEE